MTHRARITLALLAVATLPVLVLGVGVRREMGSRLDQGAARARESAAAGARTRLAESVREERRRLESLAADLVADNRFRLALANGAAADRRWLLDWASGAMRGAGFVVLQLQDSAGRILSSGHFRNDFDRTSPSLPEATAASPHGAAVVDARTPDGIVRALVASVRVGAAGADFTLTGGVPFDSARVAALAPDAAVEAVLRTRAGSAAAGDVIVDSLPYVNEATTAGRGTARLALVADDAATDALKASVTRWLLLTLAVTCLAALAAAAALGRLVSAPLTALAERTARLDLDRLDQRFASGRADELGALERTLDALAGRLRASVSRLRDAERAAATGDLARQVNHDIKNGLAPIRNVLRHLAQVAEREPGALAATFLERKATLESSVEYLDALARNYQRPWATLSHGPTDARAVAEDVARGVTAPHATMRTLVPATLPPVLVDAVVLKRVLENLVSNAVDALEGRPGTVTIGGDATAAGEERRVRLTVSDTGRGMTRDELRRAFDDFHTTKPTGTGLGLSVVRRLLTDVGGAVRAETAPGEGTTFTIELPAR